MGLGERSLCALRISYYFGRCSEGGYLTVIDLVISLAVEDSARVSSPSVLDDSDCACRELGLAGTRTSLKYSRSPAGLGSLAATMLGLGIGTESRKSVAASTEVSRLLLVALSPGTDVEGADCSLMALLRASMRRLTLCSVRALLTSSIPAGVKVADVGLGGTLLIQVTLEYTCTLPFGSSMR